jgi:hypothetical protein
MPVKYESLEKVYKIYMYGGDSDVCSMKNQMTFDETLYLCMYFVLSLDVA